MKRAILLVDHGSRRPEANDQLAAVARAVRARAPADLVEIAHMEIAEPTVAQAIARCAAAGAERVVVFPYFLGPGRHTRESIPELVAAAAAQHPELEILTSDPLGIHEGLVDALLDRVAEIS